MKVFKFIGGKIKVGKKLNNYFDEFEKKYSTLTAIDRNWYETELCVKAFCKKAATHNTSNAFSEEWYRARFVYMLVKSGLYPREHIGVELNFPKGSSGKAIKPDILVFKSDKWIQYYSDQKFEKLREDFLVVFEAKDNDGDVEKAIEKQLEVCMERYLGDRVFGVYFDNRNDIIIVRKVSSYSLKRYNFNIATNGADYIEKLNLARRDPLNELPSFNEFFKNVKTLSNKSNLHFPDLDPLDEETFPEVLNALKRQKDKIRPKFQDRDLIVEFLTLKVYDEKRARKDNKPLSFYILPSEMKDGGLADNSFRKRIQGLYKNALRDYRNILSKPLFTYDANLRPNDADTERFLIEVVKIFQEKAILKGSNESFNQIIFNNFGDSTRKAQAGQFFTPIPIVKTIIEMLNPTIDESLCDPCCGICDFPAMAFKHIYKNSDIQLAEATNFYGFDLEESNLKLAELNLVLNGDGGALLEKMDSISHKYLESGEVSKERQFSITNYSKDTWEHLDDEQLNPKKYKIIATNPPFGKGRDLKTGAKGVWGIAKETVELYEVFEEKGKNEIISKDGSKKIKINYPKSLDLGAMFLENAYKLLEEGGKLGIILSNSIASIEEWKNIRKWFLTKMRLVATFDLPANTFGETGVATTVLIAYKPKRSEKGLLEEDYEVFTREIEDIGYTVKTEKRSIIFKPNFIIDENTFESTGEIDEGLTKMVSDFKEWLKGQRKELKKAFNV